MNVTIEDGYRLIGIGTLETFKIPEKIGHEKRI